MSPTLCVLSLVKIIILNTLLSEPPKLIEITMLEYMKITSSVALELIAHYLRCRYITVGLYFLGGKNAELGLDS